MAWWLWVLEILMWHFAVLNYSRPSHNSMQMLKVNNVLHFLPFPVLQTHQRNSSTTIRYNWQGILGHRAFYSASHSTTIHRDIEWRDATPTWWNASTAKQRSLQMTSTRHLLFHAIHLSWVSENDPLIYLASSSPSSSLAEPSPYISSACPWNNANSRVSHSAIIICISSLWSYCSPLRIFILLSIPWMGACKSFPLVDGDDE